MSTESPESPALPGDQPVSNEQKKVSASDSKVTEQSTKLEDLEVATGGSGGGKNGAGNSDNGEDKGGDDGGKNEPTVVPVAVNDNATATQSSRLTTLVATEITATSEAVKNIRAAFFSWFATFLKTVPAPVLVALISLISTVSGTKVKAARDAQTAEKARIAASRQRKREIEKTLRQIYSDLAAPMLKSAAKLAERLHVLIDADWGSYEAREQDAMVSSLYSAYLLGRYFATVEIVKEKSALLDYGFPSADRILGNILGRLQGVLAATDTILTDMQMTEHLFKPDSTQKPLRAGPLKITPRAQTVLGNLMLRRLWKDKYDFLDVHEGKDLTVGTKAMINFLEFSRVFAEDETMRRWYKPVVKDFEKLEKIVKSLPKEKRRDDRVGARIYFVQSCLLDLVEFFDPLPHPKFVPSSKRRRLRLGGSTYTAEQRAPKSLHKIYTELANLRDHRHVEGDVLERLRIAQGVEVYVSGTYGTGENKVETLDPGDCPFSHRVLITLHEMGISYRAVHIAPDAKPSWYYLLQASSQTPALYCDGEVVEDSGHIVRYLRSRFPKANALASADHLKLAVGTSSFTRFHPHFRKWLSGSDGAKDKVLEELCKLDQMLQIAQKKNEGQPFLGGASFSREDTAIAPMLHNVEVAGRGVKQWGIPQDYKALWKYLEAVRQMPSFNETVAKDEVIVEGYGRLVNSGGDKTWRLADMLE